MGGLTEVVLVDRSGRAERNHLVAQKVMGWRYFEGSEVPERHRHRAEPVAKQAAWRKPNGEWHCKLCDGEPDFEYDMNTTLAVIERMGELGWWAQIVSPFRPGDLYFCGFTPHGTSGWNGRPDHDAGSQSLPEAVCAAAIQTVEFREQHPQEEE